MVFQTTIIVVSVAKSYSNRGNHRHRVGTKKRGYLYYIDEDGNFKTRRINALEALYYKSKRVRRYLFNCPECGGLVRAFARSLDEDVECPYCSYNVSLEDLGDSDDRERSERKMRRTAIMMMDGDSISRSGIAQKLKLGSSHNNRTTIESSAGIGLWHSYRR